MSIPDRKMYCSSCKDCLWFRWQPSLDAGPFWRCCECGEPDADDEQMGASLADALVSLGKAERERDEALARAEKAEAESAVWSGKACEEEQAAGVGHCGACRCCLPPMLKEARAEVERLRVSNRILEEERDELHRHLYPKESEE